MTTRDGLEVQAERIRLRALADQLDQRERDINEREFTLWLLQGVVDQVLAELGVVMVEVTPEMVADLPGGFDDAA